MVNTNHLFSAISFIAFVLVTIPLPWHLYSWNVGTVVYMFWTGLACLKFCIDSIIWDGNAINWAPVWCDISSRIHIAASVGITAASMCINRRLYHIATTNTVTTTKAEKMRIIWTDLGLGVGIPLLAVPLQYIVQGHRFNIFEDVGCYPFTYNTPPSYILVHGIPLAIGIVSACYSLGSIYQFNKRRETFNALLASNNNIRVSRYWRLMALAAVEAFSTVPLAIYVIVLNASVPISPYVSWESVHAGFSRVDQIPAILWKSSPESAKQVEMSRWLFVVCAFIFFAFFGFADEAIKNYRRAFLFVCKSVGYNPTFMASTNHFGSSVGIGSKKKSGTTGSMPVFGERKSTTFPSARRKRPDSLESFSTDEYTTTSSLTENEKQASITNVSAGNAPGGNNMSWGAIDLKDVGGLLSSEPPSPVSPPAPVHQGTGRNSVGRAEEIMPSTHKVSDSSSSV